MMLKKTGGLHPGRRYLDFYQPEAESKREMCDVLGLVKSLLLRGFAYLALILVGERPGRIHVSISTFAQKLQPLPLDFGFSRLALAASSRAEMAKGHARNSSMASTVGLALSASPYKN